MRPLRDNASSRRTGSRPAPDSVPIANILFGISSESREEHERGCLLLSANMERDAKDKIIAEFLLDNQLKTEAIFTEALQRAQAGGGVSDKQDPVALARFFVATIQGMRAMAKLNSNRKALEQVAKLALSTMSRFFAYSRLLSLKSKIKDRRLS
jgi:tetracycline repressor-like protein